MRGRSGTREGDANVCQKSKQKVTKRSMLRHYRGRYAQVGAPSQVRSDDLVSP